MGGHISGCHIPLVFDFKGTHQILGSLLLWEGDFPEVASSYVGSLALGNRSENYLLLLLS